MFLFTLSICQKHGTRVVVVQTHTRTGTLLLLDFAILADLESIV